VSLVKAVQVQAGWLLLCRAGGEAVVGESEMRIRELHTKVISRGKDMGTCNQYLGIIINQEDQTRHSSNTRACSFTSSTGR
jgi:hypothetical protein